MGQLRWVLMGQLRWVLMLSCALLGLGCRSTSNPSAAAPPQAAEPSGDALPALKLTAETPNLLLTWIGEEGDFHVAEAMDQVPEGRRAQVRVVLTDQPAGFGGSVYVADLTAKRDDGSYAVRSLPRSDWEKLGADLRKTRMEALAPGAMPEPTEAAKEPPAVAPNGAITAIVYGADWCKPCHDAERYLKSLGVQVTKKNIEESRAAQAEMQEKLVRANRGGSSIPVIDVMGRILVGYSPGSLKQAVDAARASGQKHG